MFCERCGTSINDPSAAFCPRCGTPTMADAPAPAGPNPFAGQSAYAPPPNPYQPTMGYQPPSQYPPPNPYQPPRPYGVPMTPPPNYLAPAILVTLFCCLPFGIIAIINSSKVSGLMASGDYTGAMNASAAARKWCWWAVIGAAVVWGLVGCFYGGGILLSIIASSSGY